MTSTTQAYGMPGPFTAQVAAAYGEQLARLLGASNRRWWTTTDSSHTGWDPVTTHTFDALLVGHCDHLGAAILAIDED